MSQLPLYNTLDWQLDYLPPEQLRALQLRRLQAMVRYVHEASPFWRRRLDAAAVTPDDIRTLDDIRLIPAVTKQELQQDQAEHPPFGSYVATPRSHWARMTATSGTTGAPLRRVFSRRDWSAILDRFQRNPQLGPGDVHIVLGPTDGLIGPTISAAAAERCGALVIHAGRFDTETRLRTIAEFRPRSLSATASYLLYLMEAARDLGIDLRAAGVEVVQSVGEPGAAVPATRRRLEEGWGAAVVDGYGLTEIFPLGGSRPWTPDLHVSGDMAYCEILDPESGAPVAPGELGELVVTNLIGDTQPLLRYRTRDLVRLQTDDTDARGFTGTRLAGGIQGRIDDMIWYRGANIFPSAVEAAVRRFDALSPEFQIEIDGADMPTLTVRIEPARGAALDPPALDEVTAALKTALKVNPRIEVVPAGTLPRVDEKTKARRVIDRRKEAATI